jgi:hypothetical protein
MERMRQRRRRCDRPAGERGVRASVGGRFAPGRDRLADRAGRGPGRGESRAARRETDSAIFPPKTNNPPTGESGGLCGEEREPAGRGCSGSPRGPTPFRMWVRSPPVPRAESFHKPSSPKGRRTASFAGTRGSPVDVHAASAATPLDHIGTSRKSTIRGFCPFCVTEERSTTMTNRRAIEGTIGTVFPRPRTSLSLYPCITNQTAK